MKLQVPSVTKKALMGVTLQSANFLMNTPLPAHLREAGSTEQKALLCQLEKRTVLPGEEMVQAEALGLCQV